MEYLQSQAPLTSCWNIYYVLLYHVMQLHK